MTQTTAIGTSCFLFLNVSNSFPKLVPNLKFHEFLRVFLDDIAVNMRETHHISRDPCPF